MPRDVNTFAGHRMCKNKRNNNSGNIEYVPTVEIQKFITFTGLIIIFLNVP